MSRGHFKIVRGGADRLEIALSGELDEVNIKACDREARAELSIAKARSIKVTIDLSRVEGYSLEARDALVVLQRQLGGVASQTAYVTASSPGRSLALWTSHMTSSQVIDRFSNREDAFAWVASSTGPSTGVHEIRRADEREAAPRRRRSTRG
jgi:hypothetical protein